METAVNKDLNTVVLNLIPSKTVREHLLKESYQLTKLEQLKVIYSSIIDINKKKELYLKYTLEDSDDIRMNACRMIGEIEEIKFIMQNSEEKYRFEVYIGEEVYDCDTIEAVESMIDNNIIEYLKVVVIEKATEEVITMVWFNLNKEIVLFELWHDFEDREDSNLPELIYLDIPLPFKVGDKVHLVKGLGDNEEYEVVKNLSEESIISGVITLVNTYFLKEKLRKEDLILNYEYYDPLIIE